VLCAAVPKVVLRAINSPGRLPPDFCPTTVGTTTTQSSTTPITSVGNRPTAAANDPDSVLHFHASSAPPTLATLPSDNGYLLNCYLGILIRRADIVTCRIRYFQVIFADI